MKRILTLLFAVMLSVSLMSFAQYGSTDSQSGSGQGAGQGSGHGSGMHGDHMKMDPQAMINDLDQQLSLTAEQKSKISTILENSNKHAQELRSNTSGDQAANHEALKQLHENTKSQVRATLTDEQKTKFDAMMKQHEEMNANGHHSKSSTSTTTTDTTTESPK